MANDDLTVRLISILRDDARRPVSDLAADLGVSRATVRSRMDRLQASGEVLGYAVVLREDAHELPIRAAMMLAIEGKRARSAPRTSG